MMPIKIMRMRSPSGGGGGSSYLDGLATAPNYVWSLDKEISTAINCIDVRRSSDDAVATIGFSGDTLDTGALALHVGSDSGYVAKVYGQNGAGDLVMATTARQPRIVNAGTYLDLIEFDNSNDCLQSAALTLGTAQLWLFGEWESADTGAANAMIFELGTDYSADATRFGVYQTPGTNITCALGALATRRIAAFFNDEVMDLWTIGFDKTLTGFDEMKVWSDGVLRAPSGVASNEQTGTFGNHVLNIGSRNGGASLPAPLKMRKLVLYAADMAALRTDVEGVLA